eukprot:scaffold663_cov169-Ochromonas_danica.AAC.3
MSQQSTRVEKEEEDIDWSDVSDDAEECEDQKSDQMNHRSRKTGLCIQQKSEEGDRLLGVKAQTSAVMRSRDEGEDQNPPKKSTSGQFLLLTFCRNSAFQNDSFLHGTPETFRGMPLEWNAELEQRNWKRVRQQPGSSEGERG